MTKKLSIALLAIILLSLVLSLTSCAATGDSIIDALYKILPDENSSEIAEVAHKLTEWLSDQFDAFLKFEWAKDVWRWIDSTFGISDKFEQTASAFELIKTGDFNNILSGLGTILTSGVVLVIFGILALVVVAISVLVDFIVEILLAVLSIVLIVAVVLLAIVGFIYILVPVL